MTLLHRLKQDVGGATIVEFALLAPTMLVSAAPGRVR